MIQIGQKFLIIHSFETLDLKKQMRYLIYRPYFDKIYLYANNSY